ncbi:hypothetical protein N7508_004569 [Penicillium antarcticum]|uniref:uncharacterized protein n=1 Tax=Penicillium antarcticum TaxID=416450 RepID=UPI002382B95E|nr:uncharacterized protein N7508_004569 [Penicillium antarcticum]KAJ5309190.1 hypothetical protein N7508_004569 [Penicillium antarcticum]
MSWVSGKLRGDLTPPTRTEPQPSIIFDKTSTIMCYNNNNTVPDLIPNAAPILRPDWPTVAASTPSETGINVITASVTLGSPALPISIVNQNRLGKIAHKLHSWHIPNTRGRELTGFDTGFDIVAFVSHL